MRATMSLLPSALVALAFAGCNPGSFNSLLDKAPVVSFTPPGSSTGSLFVLPLPPPADGTSAARMLVSRKDADFLGVADFDKNGKVTLHEASAADKANLGNTSVYSAAMRDDGMILVGTPRYSTNTDPPGGRVSSILPQSDGAGGYNFNVQGGLQGGQLMPHVGIAVAAGNVTGLPTGNFVALGDNTVQVLGVDAKTVVAATEPSCTHVDATSTVSEPYAFRSMVVGDLLTGGFDEIAIGIAGRVLFLQWNGTAVLPCPTKILSMPPLQSFGASLAVDDFDGDGVKDLAVGAPLDKVFVFFGPLDTVTTPSVVINNSGATGFGQRIASYRLPGMVSAQLLVGDKAGTAAGGRAGGGRVLLFTITRLYPGLTDGNAVASFFDSNPDSDVGVFGGTNLGGLLFNTGLCVPGGPVQIVPWASNNIDVLTFFNYVGAPQDPRCFSLQP
jgi:hypothetical protein